MLIRTATVEDAEAAAHLLRRSIVELCLADHGGDPTFLAEWLDLFRSFLATTRDPFWLNGGAHEFQTLIRGSRTPAKAFARRT